MISVLLVLAIALIALGFHEHHDGHRMNGHVCCIIGAICAVAFTTLVSR